VLKFCFYVPESHLDLVKEAVFSAGAGKIETYDSCCWQGKGQGKYRPLTGSEPFVGFKDHLETIDEYKVEMLLEDKHKVDVLKAFKKAHPYEVPAYDFVSIEQ